jgi:hypothetical protein
MGIVDAATGQLVRRRIVRHPQKEAAETAGIAMDEYLDREERLAALWEWCRQQREKRLAELDRYGSGSAQTFSDKVNTTTQIITSIKQTIEGLDSVIAKG